MQTRAKTKQFANAILDAITPIIAAATESEMQEVGRRLMKTLHGEAQDEMTPPKMSRDEQFAVNLFKGHLEISACVERLKDCETYISRFPFSGTRVSRSAYFKMVVEYHLHEIYILRERLLAYVKLIARAYKSDERAKKVSEVAGLLDQYVSTAFSGFVRVRGSHVHQSRYTNDYVERIELIALLQKSPDKPFSRAIRAQGREAIADMRTKLKAQTKTWNSLVVRVLEEYYRALLPLLFADDRKSLRYPTPARSESNPAVHRTLRDKAAQRR